MSTFTIEHDTRRYGDQTKGLKEFGSRVAVSGVTADQAESIAAAMSSFMDAGLTDQYLVARCDPSAAVLMSNPPQYKCRRCGQQWTVGNEGPACPGWTAPPSTLGIALAVMEERERAAKVAENASLEMCIHPGCDCDYIAFKIRSGE